MLEKLLSALDNLCLVNFEHYLVAVIPRKFDKSSRHF